MNRARQIKHRVFLLVAAAVVLTMASRWIQAETGTCGGQATTLPFTDVSAGNIFFCSIAQAYFTGLTNGTTATTYGPSSPVPREQMAAFITRTQDSVLRRGSRRAALKQWWTPATSGVLRTVDLGVNNFPTGIACDGEDLWISITPSGQIKRVHASDGKVLGTWTGATGAQGLIVAEGRVFIAGYNGGLPGKIYVINPAATPGPVSVFEDDIGIGPNQITFDGTYLWTSNQFGSISRVEVSTGVDSTYTTGFGQPLDILWDGANLWVADNTDDSLKRIDTSNGTVLESIPVADQPQKLLFDGTNIWVSSRSNIPNNISIVRAVGGLRGTVLARLTAGIGPRGMAFDGERVLVCDFDGNSFLLFKAADFTPLATLPQGPTINPDFACSDGLNFWICRSNNHDILRF